PRAAASAACGTDRGAARTPCRPSWCFLTLPFGDEARGGAQHVAPGAEDRQRGIAARQEIADALLGAVDAKLRDGGGLAQRRILAGLFAKSGGIALDVEQVVGDLEGFAQRAAVIVERLMLLLRGLAEDRARDTAIAQQRAGLHLLQPRHVHRLA